MAVTNITKIATKDVNVVSDAITFATGTTADGFLADFTGKDYKTAFIVNNTGASAATLTVKAGDSPAAASEDKVLTVPVGYSVFTLDSGYYKITKGTNRGKVQLIPSATTVGLAVVELR